ncbi:glycerol-3-phosphate dehydrogenase/oxidase [Cohnella panacarvi]|uniref:glycerol-3-phosphate dehydrogenase/oxidase n=1 Tax=Cohnella panacarvi TaxID=400776 RepID=UPI00047A0A39|nr:FAD-dependent oxidoreductase [Cohnella panacarvi]
MAREKADLLIVGGGITGAGIALDAAARGMRAYVVEMQDFAAGTSSRSTKLVHGGLRYLKQLDIGVVAEVGKERAIVYENGPHVTTPVWMLLPLYKGGTFGPFMTSVGLKFYDFLAGVKKSERRTMLDVDETLEKEPLLNRQGLVGGGYYVEYRTDDARLTIEVMKKAVELGALAVNYAVAESFVYEDGKLVGAVVRDTIGGETFEIKASAIVNAAGPWVDALRDLDGSKRGKTLRLTKGVHLVFSGRRVPLRQAVYFDTPDGRMVFAIPREGKTYLGTTDTDFQSPDLRHPRMTEEDRRYLLEAANAMFPSLALRGEDVESSWAGIRPLIRQEGKDPSEISRRDEIFVSESGLVSIAGGKLTGYRAMAEAVVGKVSGMLQAKGHAKPKGKGTANLPISGGEVGGSGGYESYVQRQIPLGAANGLDQAEAGSTARRYGSNCPVLFALAGRLSDYAARHGLPLGLAAELAYAVSEECAVKPEDFWIRRTGKLFFDIAFVREWEDAVHSGMAELCQWDDATSREYRLGMKRCILQANTPADE